MRRWLYILLVNPIVLGILGATVKWLAKADDATIIGSLMGLFIVGLAGIFYEGVVRCSGKSTNETTK